MKSHPALAHASPDTRELNPTVFGAVRSEDPVPYQTTHEKRQARIRGREALFQDRCERHLITRGYGRRTSQWIQHGDGGKWIIHLPRTKGNPILMELILLDSTRGAYIEIELKTEGGYLSPDQRARVLRHEVVVCWNFEQFKDAVAIWETALEARYGDETSTQTHQ